MKMLKTKVGKCRDRIQGLYSPKIGGLANGLSNKPWIEEGKQVTEDGKLLTLQDKMEKKWGLEKGFLNNRPYRKGDPIKEEFQTYYQRTSWQLNDGCTVLDLSKMDDELGYYMFLDSKYVANSEREWKERKWPKATHYIALENEAEELKYSKNQQKSKAFANLHAEAMTPSVKQKMVCILELTRTTTTLTTEQVDNLLYDFVDKTTFGNNSNLDKFLALFNLLSTPVGREELDSKYLLKQGLDTRVLYEKQGAYSWVRPSGLIILGETYSEAIDFLMNPKKSSLVDELKEEIKFKNL